MLSILNLGLQIALKVDLFIYSGQTKNCKARLLKHRPLWMYIKYYESWRLTLNRLRESVARFFLLEALRLRIAWQVDLPMLKLRHNHSSILLIYSARLVEHQVFFFISSYATTKKGVFAAPVFDTLKRTFSRYVCWFTFCLGATICGRLVANVNN